MIDLPVALIILLLNILSVVLIVKHHRFDWEVVVRKRFGIDRHWWIPLVVLGLSMVLSIVSFSSVQTVFVQKFDIIALVFSFGVLSEGLRASGLFQHLAYKVVEKGKGSTSRLILYMFVLTSAVTLFTSNDIVVYVLTPIVVSICFQASIKNTKLLLLSQFIAANTLSMGMLIGSPTNLILAESINLNFFSYLFIMILPAFIAFLSSFLLLRVTVKILNWDRFYLFSDFEFQESYSIPDNNPEPVVTNQMRDWILIFGFFVALVAAVTVLNYSLLWSAVPAVIISLIYWHFSSKHETGVKKPLGNLPYGIFFFGMTFFIFAEQFSRTGFVNTELVPFLQSLFEGNTVTAAITGVFGSGLMVNTFLDLPSAAIISEILPKLELSQIGKTILTQASLVGLNIGTYVTSIGALAGLIWFEEMRTQRVLEEDRKPELQDEMNFPDRMDLVRYGVIHFVFTGLFAVFFLILEAGVLELFGLM